jgi:hypothetical protein
LFGVDVYKLSGSHWTNVWSPIYVVPLIVYVKVIEYIVGCGTSELRLIEVVEVLDKSIDGMNTGRLKVSKVKRMMLKYHSEQFMMIGDERLLLYVRGIGAVLDESILVIKTS